MTIDKQLIKERFEAGLKRYDKLALVQQQICRKMAAALGGIVHTAPESILEIGAGTGFLTRELSALFPGAEFTVNDLTPMCGEFTGPILKGLTHSFLWGDAEEVPLPGRYDMIASASAVQWFDDMERFIEKCSRAVATGGHLAISTFGPDNFHEIKDTTGETLDYIPLGRLKEMMASHGFGTVFSDEYTDSLRFASPVDVLHHIKATGVNGIKRNRWTRQTLARFDDLYRRLHTDDTGMATLTYHPMILIARKKILSLRERIN